MSSSDVAESRLDVQRDLLQRDLFREAVTHAREGRLEQAEGAVASLGDYALVPYLELEVFKSRLDTLSGAGVEAYLERHGGTVVGAFMQRAWLEMLARSRDWEQFLAYAGAAAPRGMRCDYITALRATGRHAQADRQTRALWQTGYSLPDHCDAVLASWLQRLSPTEAEQMHWQRARLALQAGQSGLATYLLRKIPGTGRFQSLLAHPQRLSRDGFELAVNDFNRELVLHTLNRLAALDIETANTLWHQLDRRFQFTPAQNFGLRDRFAREMIAGGAANVRDWLEAEDRHFEVPYLTQWRVRLALKEGDWEAAQYFIGILPPKLRDQPAWRYWWARADMEIHRRMRPEAHAILRNMAAERGYYSFLAADLLNQDYQLGAKRTVKLELLEDIARIQAVQRARELYWHGLVRNANIEWRSAIQHLTREEQVAAAQLARDWGWHYAAVTTAIRAGEWDDLELRFPLAFHETFAENARARNLELSWVYAIARQESAFAEHARSRVGALGIMQLMPSTARTIARQMGRPAPAVKDLFDPALNIEMGSFYLWQLLEEFDGNLILATAAYNAGPGRVQRVLARQDNPVPADIWIENLPYSETRAYIKGVLAFSVVYGLKLQSCPSPSVQSGCDAGDGGRFTLIGPN